MFYYFNELLDTLSSKEVLVFSFIHAIYYRNLNENENRFFLCSNDYISKKLHISQPTISRCIKSLTEKGLIEVIYQTIPTGQMRYIIPQLIDLENILEEQGGKKTFLGGDNQNDYDPINKMNSTPYSEFIHNKNISNKNDLNIKESKKRKNEVNNSFIPSLKNDSSIIEEWNEIAKKYGLSCISTLTPTRLKHFNKRCLEAGGKDMFFKIIDKALQSSEFLRGRNIKHWKASFDFFLRQSSFVKSAEGVYSKNKVAPVVKAVTDTKEQIENDDLFSEFNFKK